MDEQPIEPAKAAGSEPVAPQFVFGAGNLDRPPLVLLAGMLGDSTVWDEISQRCNDIVKPWPVRIDLDDSVPELAASVLAQAPDRFLLAGHSLGGIVALEVQRQAPERVSGLVLFNTSGRAPSEAQQRAWSSWRDRTAAGEFLQIAAELGRATLAPANLGLQQANTRMADTVGPDGFLRQLAAQATRPSLGRLSMVGVPVLVFSGELDLTCPPELQRELVAHCPGAELVEVAGAGHLLPLEVPDAVVPRLRSWLAVQVELSPSSEAAAKLAQ